MYIFRIYRIIYAVKNLRHVTATEVDSGEYREAESKWTNAYPEVSVSTKKSVFFRN